MAIINLALVFGLPGAGKTSLCRSLLAHGLVTSCGPNAQNKCSYHDVPSLDYSRNCTFVHVCYDDIISPTEQRKLAYSAQKLDSEGNGLQVTNKWKLAREAVAKTVNHLVEVITRDTLDAVQLLALVKDYGFKTNLTKADPVTGLFVILIDDNLYYRSMRHAYYSMAAQHKVSFCEVFINSSIVTAKLNNKNRRPDEVVPGDVMERMAENIEPPEPAKYHWEKYCVYLKPETPTVFTGLENYSENLSLWQVQDVASVAESSSADFTTMFTDKCKCTSTDVDNDDQLELSINKSYLLSKVASPNKEINLSEGDNYLSNNGPLLEFNNLSVSQVIKPSCDAMQGKDTSSKIYKEKSTYTLSCAVTTVLRNLFIQSMNSPVLDREVALQAAADAQVSRVMCSKSVMHRADLILRQLVATTIVEQRSHTSTGRHNRVPLQQYAKIANMARQHVLTQVKNGTVALPGSGTPDTDEVMRRVLHSSFMVHVQRLGETGSLLSKDENSP